jgi:hypothetical protein
MSLGGRSSFRGGCDEQTKIVVGVDRPGSSLVPVEWAFREAARRDAHSIDQRLRDAVSSAN